ncbi:tripartite tricarboxylate transporter substrate binding protein [Acetobacteraceae bacterium H6797]|nr:tripartite tricarboxylate transporter substrate binding protein [Acetobacteraceae bacterium H6797]
MTAINRRMLLGSAGALLAAGTLPARAQSWPDRPIRLVVPFPAGGPNDVIARVVGQKMSSILGQPVVVENRSGGGGVLGTDNVAKSNADGYTIGVTSAGALSIASSLMPNIPYDSLKDLAPVTLVATVPELLVINPKVPTNNLRELVEYAKKNPGKLNFASSGSGSVPHLAGEQLRFAADIEIIHVPYRGAAPAVTDLIAGQVQMMFADLPVLMPHVQSGALKAIALGSAKRAALLPNVQTTAEAGFPAVQADNWYGMVAPGRTPEPVLTKLRDATSAALADPQVQQTLREQGATAVGNSPAEFATYIRSEAVKWGDIVKKSGATLD